MVHTVNSCHGALTAARGALRIENIDLLRVMEPVRVNRTEEAQIHGRKCTTLSSQRDDFVENHKARHQQQGIRFSNCGVNSNCGRGGKRS